MLALDQLKGIVLNNIEKTGFLDNIRAQLKSNVYKIVDQQSDDLKKNAGFQWEHPLNTKILQMQNGSLAINLMAEFMEYYKLEYSLSVFKKEMHIGDKYVSRETLSDQLQMKHTPETNKPILLILIQEFQKIMDVGMSGSFAGYGEPFRKKKDGTQTSESSVKSFGIDKPVESARSDQQVNPSHQKSQESDSEDEETKRMRAKLEALEKERIQTELEQERKRQEEQEAREEREKIEREYNERKEKERQKEEEKQRKEEEKKRKEEEKKKEEEARKRPKTAPVVKKELPKTAVNKIRGGGGASTSALLGIYGSSLISGTQPQQDEYDPYGGYDMGDDPYAFDHTEINAPSQTAYGNFYGGQQEQGGYGGKFSGSSGMVDPYAAIDFTADLTSNKKKKNKKGGIDDDDMDHYLEENIDEFGQSSGSNQFSREKDKKNPLFTSSEDMYIGSQSVGQDMTVDSDAIDGYDYVERVSKPR